MPKVQVSALITDIKGKSNGSVFSNNSGGLYFRNNPSGGGKKSPKWDKQKSRMITVSQSWKNLDIEVQEAWNSAVNDFPTTNAFGATRIPTGYELFVRLNTVQLTYDNTLLVNPPSPRTAPSTGEINVDYPELFQFNPQYHTSLYNTLSPITPTTLVSDNVLDSFPVMGDSVFSFRLSINSNLNPSFPPTESVSLMFADDLAGNVWSLDILNISTGTPLLSYAVTAGFESVTVLAELTTAMLKQPLQISIVSSSTDFDDYFIYVNGVNATTSRTASTSPDSATFTADMIIGATGSVNPVFASFSDIRLFTGTVTADQLNLIYNGYVLGTEEFLFSGATLTGSKLVNEGTYSSDYNFEIQNYASNIKYLQPCSFGLVPLFSLELENTGSPNFAVNIYATPPISNGRTGKMSNYKLLGSFDYDTETSFALSHQLKALFGNIAPNSQIAFYLQVYDKTTGVVSPVKSLATRKRPRFKAGSDLSGKVM